MPFDLQREELLQNLSNADVVLLNNKYKEIFEFFHENETFVHCRVQRSNQARSVDSEIEFEDSQSEEPSASSQSNETDAPAEEKSNANDTSKMVDSNQDNPDVDAFVDLSPDDFEEDSENWEDDEAESEDWEDLDEEYSDIEDSETEESSEVVPEAIEPPEEITLAPPQWAVRRLQKSPEDKDKSKNFQRTIQYRFFD